MGLCGRLQLSPKRWLFDSLCEKFDFRQFLGAAPTELGDFYSGVFTDGKLLRSLVIFIPAFLQMARSYGAQSAVAWIQRSMSAWRHVGIETWRHRDIEILLNEEE